MARHDSDLDFHDNVPPFSRLFLIHGKGVEEVSIRDAFEKYGHVQDLYMVKDKRTHEPKGFSYVKFSRTSEAALAMEEMNGRTIDGCTKGIKVVLANNRGEGSGRDPQEDEKMLRIFVIIPKDYGNKDLRKNFEEFGDIDFVETVKDRRTGKAKGFGYVKYLRPYHAALAVEKCSSSFKAKFADPLNKDRRGDRDRDRDWDRDGNQMKRGREPYDDYYDDRRRGPSYDRGPNYDRGPSFDRMMEPMPPPAQIMQNRGLMEQMQLQASMMGIGQGAMAMNRGMGMGMMEGQMGGNSAGPMGDMGLEVEALITSSHVVRPLVQKLFDLIPGLEKLNFDRDSGLVIARYATPEAASRCVDKMNMFEYPPGHPINVRFARPRRRDDGASAMAGPTGMDVSAVIENLKGMPNASHLVDAMKQIAGIFEGKPSGEINPDGSENVPYCGFPLPQKQPRLATDSECKERLFVVSKPYPINESILMDLFCRFGNLIEVYLQPGKNFGYARFGCKESALKAIDTLNMIEINGQLLKVLVADARRNDRDYSPDRKRSRNSEHWES